MGAAVVGMDYDIAVRDEAAAPDDGCRGAEGEADGGRAVGYGIPAVDVGRSDAVGVAGDGSVPPLDDGSAPVDDGSVAAVAVVAVAARVLAAAVDESVEAIDPDDAPDDAARNAEDVDVGVAEEAAVVGAACGGGGVPLVDAVAEAVVVGVEVEAVEDEVALGVALDEAVVEAVVEAARDAEDASQLASGSAVAVVPRRAQDGAVGTAVEEVEVAGSPGTAVVVDDDGGDAAVDGEDCNDGRGGRTERGTGADRDGRHAARVRGPPAVEAEYEPEPQARVSAAEE